MPNRSTVLKEKNPSAVENVRRSTRAKTVPEFFMKQKQSTTAKRRKGSTQDQNSDEEEKDELDTDDSSDNDSSADENDTAKSPKNPKTATARKTLLTTGGRRKKTAVTVAAASQLLEQMTEEEDANSLYSQVESANVDVDDLVNEWMAQYANDKTAAVSSLVDFMIRSSGCMMSVRQHAFDSDDVAVDVLQELQGQLAELPYHEYPIISKSKHHKQLKNNLLNFFQSLIDRCQHEVIYDGVLIETLQSWLTTMSSSVYRPFRHTASVIALKVMSALCVVAEKNNDELVIVARQLETEKRKTGRARNASKLRLLQQRHENLGRKRKDLQEYLDDFFEGVFVHRARDVESVIRSECIKELCDWVQQHSVRFSDNQFLRYFGWAFNDQNGAVRSESLKAVARLCKIESIVEKLGDFMQRFKTRIEDMALYDVDTSVRVNAIALCSALFNHSHELLTVERRSDLANLIFSDEPRIRKAVAPFVKAVFTNDILEPEVAQVQEALQKQTGNSRARTRRGGNAPVSVSVNKTWVAFKSLASFLATRTKGSEEEGSMDVDQSLAKTTGSRSASLTSVVESLWGHIQELQDYESMSEFLCHDHSTVQESQASSTDVDTCYKLSEEEETVLVNVLVECVKLAAKNGVDKASAREKKKDEGQLEEIRNDVSRHLVQVLSKLLTKYADDPHKMTVLVSLPQMMNLNVYLELRMTQAYRELMQGLSKLFLGATLPKLLENCSQSLQHMAAAKYMAEVNDVLLPELQERVVAQVRDACRGKDLLTARFTVDTIHAISVSVSRLDHLLNFLDATDMMDETEDMSVDVTDLVGGLVDRACLGYEKEAQISASALAVLFRYIAWKCERVSIDSELLGPGSTSVSKLEKRRDWVLEKMEELVTGSEINPVTNVSYTAFGILVDIYWLLSSDLFSGRRLEHLRTRCPSDKQAAYAKYIENVMDAWFNEDDAAASQDIDDVGTQTNRRESFTRLMVSFARAIMLGVIHVQHATVFVSQYGRCDEMDEVIKALVNELKSDLTGNETSPDDICRAYLDSLKKSFDIHIQSPNRSFEKTLKLARVQNQSLKHAEQEEASRRVSPHVICERIHIDGITFALARASSNGEVTAHGLKFFKVLAVFAKQLSRARDVGRIHKHLEDCLAQNHLSVDANDKEWEAYHAYVKAINQVLKRQGLRYDATRRTEHAETPAAIEFADTPARMTDLGDAMDDDAAERLVDEAFADLDANVDSLAVKEGTKRMRAEDTVMEESGDAHTKRRR